MFAVPGLTSPWCHRLLAADRVAVSEGVLYPFHISLVPVHFPFVGGLTPCARSPRCLAWPCLRTWFRIHQRLRGWPSGGLGSCRKA